MIESRHNNKLKHMKVGVISKGSPDYLIDIVCDGLIKILGRKNVALDYDHQSRWGGQYSILMGGVEQANSFDIHDADVLVTSDRSIPQMEAWLKKTGKKKVALLDGEDDSHLRYDARKVSVYFKREYLIGSDHPKNVRPLSFAAIPEAVPRKVKIERPVFYLGFESNPIRKELAEVLRKEGYELTEKRIEKADYNNLLVSSLVGVSVRGCGWDTYRYWEIPYFGVTLLSQKLQIEIPNNFLEDYEAVFFESMDEMLSKLKYLVNNPEVAIQIGARGRKAALERHLAEHRARTVLEALA